MKLNKKNIIILTVIAVIAVIVSVVCFVSCNKLSGDDEIVYELILDVSSDFKSPSSVRLVEGQLNNDKDGGWFNLSGSNSYGATVSDWYFIYQKNGKTYLSETSYEHIDDNLNVSKINNALENYWG